MSKKIIFSITVVLLSGAIAADEPNCLSVPLGLTSTNIANEKKSIAATKTEIAISVLDAMDEAVLSAKAMFKDKPQFNINGAYLYEKCVLNNYAFVAIAIDTKSEKISTNLNKLLQDSFNRQPAPK